MNEGLSEFLRRTQRVVDSNDSDRVRLGYSALTFTMLSVIVGRERSIFEQLGIDLKLQQIRGDQAIPALLNDELDYAIGVLPTVWAAAEGF